MPDEPGTAELREPSSSLSRAELRKLCDDIEMMASTGETRGLHSAQMKAADALPVLLRDFEELLTAASEMLIYYVQYEHGEITRDDPEPAETFRDVVTAALLDPPTQPAPSETREDA